MAEIDQRLSNGQRAAKLAQRAAYLRAGFAGFQSPACLTLAESLLVVGAPWSAIDDALDAALRWAHNVQDPVYCARTTARVNAMREWWRGPGDLAGSGDPLAEAEQLAGRPGRPRYAARHIVGEDYHYRSLDPAMIEFADYFRATDTLYGLAEVVYQRPVVDFTRLNETIDPQESLAPGTAVAVPDPDSGKVIRHRLNRGGNRQANHALWCIVLARMSNDPRTRAYVERRTKQGRSKKEIIRILKRYVARQVYRQLPRL